MPFSSEKFLNAIARYRKYCRLVGHGPPGQLDMDGAFPIFIDLLQRGTKLIKAFVRIFPQKMAWKSDPNFPSEISSPSTVHFNGMGGGRNLSGK